ncbi:hypothetical protein MVEN_00932400 [Mycena venus]|uniref:Uncharacterized protein n=1 Tax=Mycena venus TaxID=2733690 RepID=A0A8H6YCY0_9AGAR|nr:hypothetical protein MVEN_00932400 [Mycena venus]
MLLLLVLVHILSRNGSATRVPIPLDPRSSAACNDANNSRTLFDIVWSCLATIFACTWMSVHPNVPPPDQTQLALFWRRLKMMLIGIITPEIMVGFAARQYFSARKLAKKLELSRTHGFFLCMGGFVSSAGYPIVTLEQLEDADLGSEFLKAIRNNEAADIMDKSKGDMLSKGVALTQGLWFTTQCLARVHQQLAVTELEVVTLAFAVVNTLVWLLWWDKPLDVQRPIVLGPPRTPDAQPIIPIQPLWLEQFIVVVLGSTGNNDYDPRLSTSVPSFWSPPMNNNLLLWIRGLTALSGSVFGAIHCAAWTSDFPTTGEMWIWRSCSLVIVAIPVVTFLVLLLAIIMDETDFYEVIMTIFFFLMAVSLPIYIIARLMLRSLPFAALRSLPASAATSVNWST